MTDDERRVLLERVRGAFRADPVVTWETYLWRMREEVGVPPGLGVADLAPWGLWHANEFLALRGPEGAFVVWCDRERDPGTADTVRQVAEWLGFGEVDDEELEAMLSRSEGD
jgi:hypothetical protein